MSLNTTHSTIKSSPDSQSQMKDMGVSLFETTSLDHDIASRVIRELIPETYNIQVRNDGLVDNRRFTKAHFRELDFTK